MLKVTYKVTDYFFKNWNDFIQNGNFSNVYSYKLNGKLFDLHNAIDKGNIELVINDLSVLRHTMAHIIAHAVSRIYKDALFGIGPVTDNGCFYDIYYDQKIDIELIKKEMQNIINEDIPLVKNFVPKSQFINNNKDIIKKYIAENLIEEDTVSIYTQKDFSDICQGPHVLSTGLLKNKIWDFLELNHITWHDFKMQRLSFYMFNSQKEKQEYETQYDIQSNRDHRTICKNMELCSFPSICSGMVLWKPNGLKVIENIKNAVQNIIENDYQLIQTPPICTNRLWTKTGHLTQYKDLMFILKDEALKPMNCPEHVEFFSSKTRSYKELPLRIAEFGTCFRNERTGGLIGLKRLRSFTQDDGHIFCTITQIEKEIMKFMDSAITLYNSLGFHEIKIVVATRPEKSIGTDDEWNQGIDILKKSITEIITKYKNITYEIDVGGGAFYGPKFELHIKDNWGKFWQCGTIQIDFFLAKNLNAVFIDNQDQEQYPIVLHRAMLGSIERFLAILLESDPKLPIQIHFCPIVILPVANNDQMNKYAQNIYSQLQKVSINSKVIYQESLNKRIKITNKQYKPHYTIIIGENEIKNHTISVREEKNITNINELIKQIKQNQ